MLALFVCLLGTCIHACRRPPSLDPSTLTFHSSLKSIDWVNFSYQYSCSKRSQALSTSFSNISITSNNAYLHHTYMYFNQARELQRCLALVTRNDTYRISSKNLAPLIIRHLHQIMENSSSIWQRSPYT